ncbi:MAG: hypothetical protein GWO24_22685, partial [Akkermansiaceae bacterium]|nr:hypothetical protein [Akkermansiaceae bacterium]
MVHRLTVELDDSGAVRYSATFRGKPIVEPSLLGLRIESVPALGSGFRIVDQGRAYRRGKIETRLGERASADFEFKELGL